MSTFFLGWKRKAGCTTLVMALAVTGLWARSFARSDTVAYFTRTSIVEVISDSRGLTWSRYTPTDPRPLIESAGHWTCESLDAAQMEPVDIFLTGAVVWRWKWNGFDFGESHRIDGQELKWRVPHWSLVFSLTLLSARLILWSRKRMQRVSSKPNG